LGASVDAAVEGVGTGHHDGFWACLGGRLPHHGKRSHAQHHRPPAETDVFHEDSPSAWNGAQDIGESSHYVIGQPGRRSPEQEGSTCALHSLASARRTTSGSFAMTVKYARAAESG